MNRPSGPTGAEVAYLDRVAHADLLAQVRAHDPDRYLGALLAPADRRLDLMTLYAFDAELARIPLSVKEPLLGEIKLQWWRDALGPLLTDAGRAGDLALRTGHPLADAIADLARRHRLNPGLLHGLIDAGSFLLSDQPLADEHQMFTHLAKTEGAILALAASVLGVPASPVLDQAAERAGRAIGLVRAARRLLDLTPGAALMVPLTVWPKDDRDRGPRGAETASAEREAAASAHIRVAAGRLLDLGEAALPAARAASADLPRASRPAFLALALVPRYLRHVRRFTMAEAKVPHDINPLVRVWVLSTARWRGRY